MWTGPGGQLHGQLEAKQALQGPGWSPRYAVRRSPSGRKVGTAYRRDRDLEQVDASENEDIHPKGQGRKACEAALRV